MADDSPTLDDLLELEGQLAAASAMLTALVDDLNKGSLVDKAGAVLVQECEKDEMPKPFVEGIRKWNERMGRLTDRTR